LLLLYDFFPQDSITADNCLIVYFKTKLMQVDC